MRALARDGDTGLLAVGSFQRHLRLADTVLEGAAADDLFVARLTTRGVLEWARAFGGPGIDVARAVAVADNGDIIIAGAFHDTLAFGALKLEAAASPDAFVARLSRAGEPIWARAFPGTGVAEIAALAIGADGAIYAAGSFDESLDVGGHALASAGMQDGFVARLTPDGEATWARAIGGRGIDALEALALARDGDLVVAGYFRDTLAFGATELTAAGTRTDALLARVRGADGEPSWARRFGGGGSDAAHALAIDDGDDIVLAASFDEAAVFGGAPIEPAGDFDVALARYTAAGEHRWSIRLGGDGNETVSAVAVAGRDILVAGDFAGVAELGGTRLESAGRHDGYIARYTADGNPLWARQLAGAGHDQLGALVASAGGGVFVTGGFAHAARLAEQELTARGAYELVLAELTQ